MKNKATALGVLAGLIVGVGGVSIVNDNQICPEFVLRVPIEVNGTTTIQETCISAETRNFILNAKQPNDGFGGIQFK